MLVVLLSRVSLLRIACLVGCCLLVSMVVVVCLLTIDVVCCCCYYNMLSFNVVVYRARCLLFVLVFVECCLL